MNKNVSYQQAKLLKEKGFDENCESWAYLDDNCMAMTYDSKTCVKVPTIAEVVMWLYEKYGIWVDVVLSRNEKQFTFMIQSLSFDANKFLNEYFNSPTGAYEAAIDYCLNHIV